MIVKDYILYALVTAFFWGIMAIYEAKMGIEYREAALFVKLFVYGCASFIFYFMYKHEVERDLVELYRFKKAKLFGFMFVVLLAATFAQHSFYTAFHRSKSNAHVVITVSDTMKTIIGTLGAYIILREQSNIYSVIGIIMTITGVLMINYFGH